MLLSFINEYGTEKKNVYSTFSPQLRQGFNWIIRELKFMTEKISYSFFFNNGWWKGRVFEWKKKWCYELKRGAE